MAEGVEVLLVMKFKYRFALVVLMVLIMFILHNSFWLWELDARLPLLFGFMPFAFSYYIFYALLSVLALKLIIKLAWPDPPADFLTQAGESEQE
jgi:hypothetical protein